jgi:hypothetical protein
MSTSLCGNAFGCLTFNEDGTMGEELTTDGFSRPCPGCEDRAVFLLEFMLGESIEFMLVFDEWERKSKIQERLESMLLFRVLTPQLNQLQEMRNA